MYCTFENSTPSLEMPVQGTNVQAPSASKIKLPLSSERIISKYETVGEALSKTEQLFLTVGIPWLISSKNQSEEKAKLADLNCSCFFRSQLVGVSTEVLECYLEDLEKTRLSDPAAEMLKLENPPPKERIPFVVFGSSIGLILGGLIGFYFIASTQLSLVVIGLLVWTGFLFSLLLVSDPYRRFSFHSLLQKEINRRKGVGPGLACPT